VTISQS